MWTRTFNDGTIETFDRPGVRHKYHPLTSVKWPHGGWIVYNWAKGCWDDLTDHQRDLLKGAGI